MDEEPAIAWRMQQQRFKWSHRLHCQKCTGFQNCFECINAVESSADMKSQSKSLRGSGEGSINEGLKRSLGGVSSLTITKKSNV
jgi:hypothetical protein